MLIIYYYLIDKLCGERGLCQAVGPLQIYSVQLIVMYISHRYICTYVSTLYLNNNPNIYFIKFKYIKQYH